MKYIELYKYNVLYYIVSVLSHIIAITATTGVGSDESELWCYKCVGHVHGGSDPFGCSYINDSTPVTRCHRGFRPACQVNTAQNHLCTNKNIL